MNRKIYLIIIWTITLFVICFSGLRYSNKLGGFSFFSDGNNSDSENDWNDDEENGFGKYNYSAVIQEFSSIDADTAVLGITVKSGSDYKIEWNVSKKKLVPSYYVENGVLKITQGKVSNNGNVTKSQLTVTVPRRVQLSKIDIHTNVGEVDLSGFDATECKVKANVGAIHVDDFDFDKLEAKTNVGEIAISVIQEIDELNLNLKTNVGEVHVDGEDCKKSFNQSGSSSKKITAETNVGEIRIK